MSKDDFVSFPDYRERLLGHTIDARPEAVIMAELDEVEKEFSEREVDTNGNGNI